MSNSTKKQRKAQATKILKQLDIYEPYIKEFQNSDMVCLFEEFGGFWLDQYPEIYNKMRAFEKEHHCTVYAVTHEFAGFGEIYDFLFVSDYPEEWEYNIESSGRTHRVFAYSWNKSAEWCSDFGSITVKSFGGGIKRVS
jgi:hypothetical protein